MATITLFSGRVNEFPTSIGTLKRSTGLLSDGIDDLRLSAFGIDSSICDLDDVIAELRVSTDLQDSLWDLWEDVKEKAEEFIEEVQEIDEEVSEMIATAEEDFYSLYEYLRPGEDSLLDLLGDLWQSFSDWASDLWDAYLDWTQEFKTWFWENELSVLQFFEGLIDQCDDFLTKLTEFIQNNALLRTLVEGFINLVTMAGDFIKSVADLVQFLYWNTPLHFILGPYLIAVKALFELGATVFIGWLGGIIATDEFGDIVEVFMQAITPLLELGKLWTKYDLPGAAFIVGLIGAERFEGGIYHIRQDWWQSWWPIGYNSGYDNVFHRGIQGNGNSIAVYAEEFDLGNGQTLIIWSWKGDYVNLGAGTETGLYVSTGVDGQYGSGTAYACNMDLSLYYMGNDYEQGNIMSYNPEKAWWPNGFNSNYLNVDAADLQTTTTINFSTMNNGGEVFTNFVADVMSEGTVTYNSDGTISVQHTSEKTVEGEPATTATWTIDRDAQTAVLSY